MLTVIQNVRLVSTILCHVHHMHGRGGEQGQGAGRRQTQEGLGQMRMSLQMSHNTDVTGVWKAPQDLLDAGRGALGHVVDGFGPRYGVVLHFAKFVINDTDGVMMMMIGIGAFHQGLYQYIGCLTGPLPMRRHHHVHAFGEEGGP